MFADQDDVWFPEKIKKSLDKIKSMEGLNSSRLVFTDMTVVDANIKIINLSYWDNEKLSPELSIELKNVMLQNVAAGCSMIMTKELVGISLPFPDEIIMHDWWIMLTASVFAKVAYINEPTLYYRQHENNSVGSRGINLLKAIKTVLRFKSQIKPRLYNTQMQSLAFYNRFQIRFSTEQAQLLKAYASLKELPYIQRLRWLVNNKIYKTSLVKSIGLYFFI